MNSVSNDRLGLHGDVAVSTVASQQEGSRFDCQLGPFYVAFACSPCACVGSLWVLWLPPPKNMHFRLIGVSKLSLGASVSVHGCLSECGPVMDWQPVQGAPCFMPNVS